MAEYHGCVRRKTNNQSVQVNNRFLYYSVLSVIILTAFTYRGSLRNEFTNWDDDALVVHNPLVQDFTFNSIVRTFSQFHNNMYTPVVILSYSVEHSLFGFKSFVYHHTNMLLHLLNSILVLLLIYRLTGNNTIAFITSALFCVHPLHVESVAWIAERKDVLYGSFYISALLFYVMYRQSMDSRYIFGVYVLFVLSCLSKAAAVTLPLVLILIDFYFVKRFTLTLIKDKIQLLLISLIFGIVNLSAQFQQSFGGVVLEVQQTNVIDRVLYVFYNYLFYFFKTVIPVNLSAFYPYPDPTGPLPLVFYLSPVMTAVLVFLVYYSMKYTHKIAFGILFYTVAIFPVLQFVAVGRTLSADRFAYIPLIGVFYIVASGAGYLISHSRLRAVRFAITVLIVTATCTLAYLSARQSMIWKDSMTLYNDMLSKNPGIAEAYNNRGTLYLNESKLIQAESDFTSAIKCNGRYATAYNNLGLVYNRKAEYGKAIEYFKRAIEINNKYAEAYFNLGLAYSHRKEPEKAIEIYKLALNADPSFSMAYNNLGMLYAQMNMQREAIESFEKAVEYDSAYAIAHYNLGVSYLQSGSNNEGITHMKTAARLGSSGAMEFLKANRVGW